MGTAEQLGQIATVDIFGRWNRTNILFVIQELLFSGNARQSAWAWM